MHAFLRRMIYRSVNLPPEKVLCMHWDVSFSEESSAKTVVLGSMQREGVDDSQSDASDHAGNDDTTNSLNHHSSNDIPAAAPYGAAGTKYTTWGHFHPARQQRPNPCQNLKLSKRLVDRYRHPRELTFDGRIAFKWDH